MHPLAYAPSLAIPVIAALGVWFGGVASWGVPLLIFGLVPALELLLPATGGGRKPAHRAGHDLVLWGLVASWFPLLIAFIWRVSHGGLAVWELIGCTASVGILSGSVGLNVAHEIGHRSHPVHRLVGRLLLVSAGYPHFQVEHNRGHHARVATPDDPATARRGELLPVFWVRSITGGIRSSWALEARRLRRRSILHGSNQVLWGWVLVAALAALLTAAWGPLAPLAWAGSALVGVLLLETVNYLEHYGLQRERVPGGGYERVSPSHSWNSDHPVGRVLLFELSRHADHHANPGRRYGDLRCMPDAPTLPTGYPGMVLLALVQPLWFVVMNRRLDALSLAEGRAVQ